MLVEKDYLFHDLSLHVPPSLVCNRSMVTNSVVIGSGPLFKKELIGIARHGQRIELDPAAVLAVAQTRAAIVALATDPEPHYGSSALSTRRRSWCSWRNQPPRPPRLRLKLRERSLSHGGLATGLG
jgi:hypothetical protein